MMDIVTIGQMIKKRAEKFYDELLKKSVAAVLWKLTVYRLYIFTG